MEKKKVLLAVVLAATMVIYPILAATFVDDTQAEFNLGTYISTAWNTNRVELSPSGPYPSSGTFTSDVKDATGTSTWNSIAWVEPISYKEDLPNNGGSDPGATMTNNVLLMHLNENPAAHGSAIADTSGAGNNGTLSTNEGVTNKSIAGKLQTTAIGFDGVDDSILVPDSPTLDNTQFLTVEAWVYPTLLDGQPRAIVSKRVNYNNNDSYSLFFYTGNRLNVDIVGTGNRFASNTVFVINTWYHIAVTYDGTQAAASRVRLYVNGVQDGPARNEGSATIPNYASNLYIATMPRSPELQYWFRGTIDEVAIYNRTLSASEVLDRYKRGVLNLRLRARSCDDAACSGESWSGYYTVGSPANALSQPNNRYFQYEAFFETEAAAYTPELFSVTIDYTPESQGPVTSSTSATPNPTNCAANVTLTATVDDSTTGNSNIAGAEYFVDVVGANGSGTAMSSSDGAFDEVSEGVTASVPVGALSNGNHYLYVHGRDALGNWGATDSYALNVVNDCTGPVVSGMLVVPNPTECAITVTLTAIVDDSATGNSDIFGAEYFIDTVGAPGTGTLMNAQDGAFDSPMENVTATINILGLLPGDHTLYIHGEDILLNIGAVQSTTFTITCMNPRSASAKIALTSMLPAARNNIIMGLNLLAQANDILVQAKARNLDTAACEKLVEEAKADLAQAQSRLASPTTANYFAMRAIVKLKQALECLKALVG